MLQLVVLCCTIMQHIPRATCCTALQTRCNKHVVSLLCRCDIVLQSRRLAGLALLLLLLPHVAAQTAITDTNVGTAAIAWVIDPTTATATYGPIGDWNTAAVTSVANLFYPSNTARPTFNGDISKWNVASVSNMYRVCAL
jgi:hypothetical protein